MATALIAALEVKSGAKLATTLLPEQPWWDAEEYHQQYMAKARGAW